MFVADRFNNVGRRCSLRGDLQSRRWKVRTAVAGYRYLVRNCDTREYRVVTSREMTSLY